MTTFKKIDWLRQLFHEATKWKLSLAGQVPWRELEVKDPNNGSKFTVADLETRLPVILEECLCQNQVPKAYVPEVHKCLAYIGKQEKFDCKAISKVVKARKESLSLFEIFISYSKLTDGEKTSVVGKIEEQNLPNLYKFVLNLRLSSQGAGAASDAVNWPCQEKSKQFKLIDWLRHMYLMCQKWLNNKHGQLQWKQLNAKDPNNSKDGSRMKLDELKESLTHLVPSCLKLNIIPKPYLEEFIEVKRVLMTQGLSFNTKKLEVSENLRKIATKLDDTLLQLEDGFEDVLSVMEASKLQKICQEVSDLEQKLGEQLGVEIDGTEMGELETEEVDPGKVEEDLEETFPGEQPNILNEESMQDLLQYDLVDEYNTSDGTETMLEIMDQATVNQMDQSPLSSGDPLSPSSEILSEISSPSSPDRQLLDDHFSDDSGIFSPESNPLDLEDNEKLEDIDIQNITEGLDFSVLPDVTPFLSDEDTFSSQIEPQSSPKENTRKRKLSDDDFEIPFWKRAKP